MIKWFLKHWLNWRVGWSNWLLHNDDGDIVDCPLQTEDTNCRTMKDYIDKGKQLLTKFTYKNDGPAVLFDAMRSPASCYTNYVDGKLIDDCDGFHATLYHIAAHNNLDAYLLTYIAEDIHKCHTVLAIKYETCWAAIDYNKVRISMTDTQRLVDFVAEGNATKVVAYNLVKYDYLKGRWYIVKETN